MSAFTLTSAPHAISISRHLRLDAVLRWHAQYNAVHETCPLICERTHAVLSDSRFLFFCPSRNTTTTTTVANQTKRNDRRTAWLFT